MNFPFNKRKKQGLSLRGRLNFPVLRFPDIKDRFTLISELWGVYSLTLVIATWLVDLFLANSTKRKKYFLAF